MINYDQFTSVITWFRKNLVADYWSFYKLDISDPLRIRLFKIQITVVLNYFNLSVTVTYQKHNNIDFEQINPLLLHSNAFIIAQKYF